MDADVAVIEDPIPYLMYKDIDYIFSMDKICPDGVSWNIGDGGNTGFYAARPTKTLISIWEKVLGVLEKK